MHKEMIDKAKEIVKKHAVNGGSTEVIPYCTIAMIDLDGKPTASAITLSKHQGIEWMAFCTGLVSNKVKRMEKNKSASLCFCSETYNVTLTGHLELVTDSSIKKEMWYAPLSHHFSGPDDDQYCVLKFVTEGYNLLIDWQEARGSL